jgi:hypothetical protein
VNPENLQFNTDYLKTIQEVSGQKKDEYDDFVIENYADIFAKHPFQEKEHKLIKFNRFLNNDSLSNIFSLRDNENISKQ